MKGGCRKTGRLDRHAGGVVAQKIKRRFDFFFFSALTHLRKPSDKPRRRTAKTAAPHNNTYLTTFVETLKMDTNAVLDKVAKGIEAAEPKVEEAIRKTLGEDAAKKFHDIAEKAEKALEDVSVFARGVEWRDGARRGRPRGRALGGTQGWHLSRRRALNRPACGSLPRQTRI